MRYSYLEDPKGAYPRVLISIPMALECLDWDNNLIGTYRAIILY